jgi:cell division protease FtsH
MNKWTFSIAYFMCAILTTLMFHSWLAPEHNEVIAYSDFKRLAHDGKVLNAEIRERTITVDVDLTGTQVLTRTPSGIEHTYRGPDHRTFATFRVSDPTLIPTLQSEGVRYSAARSSFWLDEALSWLLPAIALFGIWFYIVRRLKTKSA